MAGQLKRRPEVSVVVVVHNMCREAPRSLHALSADYQRDIGRDEYEVIVVDNGSEPPFDSGVLERLTGDFRLLRVAPAPASPARAINLGLREARGDIIGVMIDGARIVTPGTLARAREGVRRHERAVVATLGWYLGDTFQGLGVLRGYDRAREDALLAAIDWPKHGYRLFEIGAMDESSGDGRLVPIVESNGLFLRRDLWEMLCGMEERFDAPGGGLLNHDLFRRAIELPEARLVVPLGEATFHQLHGGVATNVSPERQQENLAAWLSQYERIRGRSYERPRPENVTYIGTLPRRAFFRLFRNAVHDLVTFRRDSASMNLARTVRGRLIRLKRALGVLAGMSLAACRTSPRP